MPREPQNADSQPGSAAILTAIHIGAGSVSMLVADRRPGGQLRALDFLEKPAPLARDIFRTGMVGLSTTERVVSIIRGFQESLAELGLDPRGVTRTVATNILSEARNHEMVTNRIRIACGLDVGIIDDGEMTRLIYLKTRRRLQHLPAMRRENTLVVHVGPGNTRVLLFTDGGITRYTSYRMGAYRTREAVEGSHAEGPALLRVIRQHALGNIDQVRLDYADVEISGMVVIGYEVQAVAGELGGNSTVCSLHKLRQFTTAASEWSDVELVKRFQLDYQASEALLPALEVNLAIAESVRLDEIHIPRSEYERGLLHDILVSSERELVGTFAEEVLRSARILAARYQSDPRHGTHVGQLCDRLFHELADLHTLDEHDELLLQVAAILHEVGTYVSPRAHHKHSEYLILNSEIFGLDRIDLTIVALVARYHRHSGPSLEHRAYANLATKDRIRVCKLAALLRVADALERTHEQRVSDITFRREPGRLRMRLPGLGDTAVERLAMASKGDLFEKVFGLTVTIDEEH